SKFGAAIPRQPGVLLLVPLQIAKPAGNNESAANQPRARLVWPGSVGPPAFEQRLHRLELLNGLFQIVALTLGQPVAVVLARESIPNHVAILLVLVFGAAINQLYRLFTQEDLLPRSARRQCADHAQRGECLAYGGIPSRILGGDRWLSFHALEFRVLFAVERDRRPAVRL